MLYSMTGHGSSQGESENFFVSVEIKSLNSKFLDIFTRLPKNNNELDIEIRNLITTELERGKIEVNINLSPKSESKVSSAINRALFKAYFNDLNSLSEEMNLSLDAEKVFAQVLNLPNVVQNESVNEEVATEIKKITLETAKKAIQKVKEFRSQEGEITLNKFKEYIQIIAESLEKVSEQDPNRIIYLRERINKAIEDFIGKENIDKNRFEQELIFYVEKFDISEEKTRLSNHLGYFIDELKKNSNGKRLNFISQEIGREINTIGSKSNDIIIQKLVVTMKEELEKIKEQTMNIL